MHPEHAQGACKDRARGRQAVPIRSCGGRQRHAGQQQRQGPAGQFKLQSQAHTPAVAAQPSCTMRGSPCNKRATSTEGWSRHGLRAQPRWPAARQHGRRATFKRAPRSQLQLHRCPVLEKHCRPGCAARILAAASAAMSAAMSAAVTLTAQQRHASCGSQRKGAW